VLISGVTGIGKTMYLTQVIAPACHKLGLTPLFIILPDYFNARDKIGDLAANVVQKMGYRGVGTDETGGENE